jgi:sugar/nucleoside kinase (ribokinase family)
VTYDGASYDLDLDSFPEALIAQCRHVHLASYRGRSNHDQYLNFIRRVRASGRSISLDVGWDDTGEWFEGLFEILPEIDLFFCNDQEALHFSRCHALEEALGVFGRYAATTVVKLGQMGAVSVHGDSVTRSEGFNVPVVDTTGAGDSFNAGYLYGWLSGDSPTESLRLGNACGGLSVTRPGGSAAFPTREELALFLRGRQG